MPRGRIALRPKAGYYYRTDSDLVMYVVKVTEDPKFPLLVRDPDGGMHRYTAKGKYEFCLGNHPMHFKREVRNQGDPYGPEPAPDKPGPRERARRNIGKIAVARALKPAGAPKGER